MLFALASLAGGIANSQGVLSPRARSRASAGR